MSLSQIKSRISKFRVRYEVYKSVTDSKNEREANVGS